ncbi:MAG: ATP-binding protein [Chitinophagales bacterium]|nr:ATP-binding protein [Chitinophagales bacterium]MDW8418669.1 ATP-binding protein [Chitinophagales bacterium]
MEAKIIAITGPESTGKTTLATQLAQHFGTVCLPDISRGYIDKIQRPYTCDDVYEIAREIIAEETKALSLPHRFVFSDNCLLNIKIWLEFYGWHVPDWLIEHIQHSPVALYILCDIDVEWQKDNQRSNPDDREELLFRFMKELTSFDKTYYLHSGLGEARLLGAVHIINNHFGLLV